MTTKNAQQRAEHLREKLGENTTFNRAMEVVGVNVEDRTVELAFSSEAEVPRWFGVEILSHDEGACDLARLNDGAALLDNHDRFAQRGVVEKAWIDSNDRRGRALVRFGKSPAADELFQDVADKIKRHVSVGYRVLAIRLTEEREGVDVYTVTSWEPYEISIVSVPADASVGVGRSADISPMERAAPQVETSTVPPSRDASIQEGNTANMKEKTLRDATGNLVRAMVDDDGKIVNVIEVIERAGDGERSHVQRGHDAERSRVRALTDAAGAVQNVDGVDELLRTALAEGQDVATFQRALLEKLNERANKPLNEQARGADIGLTDAEAGRFSILRVVRSLMEPNSRSAREEAAFEFEASRAAAEKSGKSVDKFMIPTDVLRQSMRALNTGGVTGSTAPDASGSNLVATDLMSGSFIEVLRNRTTIMKNGRVLSGLVGNIDIPKQLAAAQGFWLGEDDDTTETGVELGQIPLSPKTVGAFTEYTRRMAMQSSIDAEALLRVDLASALALTIDKAGYYGTGSDHQPKGIALYTGINAVPFAASLPNFSELVAMETAIAADNADVNGMRYVGNAGFRGHCKTTEKFANTGATLWEQGGTVNGYGTDITNQVNAGDVFFGNFADLLIAMWGGLELQVDPYSGSKKGRVRIVVFQDVDFALRRVESFALGRMPAP